MIDPHVAIKLLHDMAKRGEPAAVMGDIWQRLTADTGDMPLDIQQKVLSILAGQEKLKSSIFKQDIEKFMLSITGIIDMRDVIAFFDARSDEKGKIYDIVQKMETAGLIIRTGNRHGTYRLVDRNPHLMNLDAPEEKECEIKLPLLLHDLVTLYGRNIILCSGEKDGGKTAFALNAAYLNRDIMPVRYFNSEMGLEELRSRLKNFPSEYTWREWKKITWFEQARQFEDFIDPNGLNIIDFFEVGAEAYTVTEDIRRVFDKLDKGLLLIVMQKRSYKEYAVGGEGTLEKARLAINLEHKDGKNLARITVAKNWKSDNPKWKVCEYKVYNGGEMKFAPKGYWEHPVKEQEPATRTGLVVKKKPGKKYDLGTVDSEFVREAE